jgi:hypothetical protein
VKEGRSGLRQYRNDSPKNTSMRKLTKANQDLYIFGFALHFLFYIVGQFVSTF